MSAVTPEHIDEVVRPAARAIVTGLLTGEDTVAATILGELPKEDAIMAAGELAFWVMATCETISNMTGIPASDVWAKLLAQANS